MKKYGYVRVSSRDQNPARQLIELKKLGIAADNIFIDKMSGKDFHRPGYRKMVRKLKKDDTLVIYSIDRLGRDYDEIQRQWRYLVEKKQINIEVIDMPLLNSNNTEINGLTGRFLSELVLKIMAYVAETERSLIKKRQAEGIAAAKKRGVVFGASKKSLPKGFNTYYKKWKKGKITLRKAADELHISYSTFYRRCKELENK